MLTDLAAWPGWIPQTGATGLLLGAVWAVLTGRIVPRATHNEVRLDRDAYRRTAETALEAAAQSAANVARLTAAVEQQTTAHREMLALIQQLVPAGRP